MPIQHIVLFDGIQRNNLLPLTATRAVADLRIGILTIREKWEKMYQSKIDILTHVYLQPKYSYSQKEDTLFVNASCLPSKELLAEFEKLENNILLKNKNGQLIAVKRKEKINNLNDLNGLNLPSQQCKCETVKVDFPWNIFTLNGQEISNDILLMGLKPNPEKLSSTNTLLGNEIYIEDGVTCECSILNTNHGPIYLGKDAEIMEGCTVRGPFALGTHATLKMQTKIYGDSTIGPYSKVGGEVANSVIFGFSNKGHDGFLGNSVIGEWCNLGADTNNSNLKNNYGKIKVWNYSAGDFIDSGLQFCGIIMGDHAKSSINTMFNTGTVVGVSANVFGNGFPSKFIRDFSWGNDDVFELDKAFEVAQRMMERRGLTLSETDKSIMKHIYESK